MGIVNLFADMTYEGASSIKSAFLGDAPSVRALLPLVSLPVSVNSWVIVCVFPPAISVTRSGKYWPVTFVGYAINLLAVPALALAGTWQLAGALVITERIGRAIRKPYVVDPPGVECIKPIS